VEGSIPRGTSNATPEGYFHERYHFFATQHTNSIRYYNRDNFLNVAPQARANARRRLERLRSVMFKIKTAITAIALYLLGPRERSAKKNDNICTFV